MRNSYFVTTPLRPKIMKLGFLIFVALMVGVLQVSLGDFLQARSQSFHGENGLAIAANPKEVCVAHCTRSSKRSLESTVNVVFSVQILHFITNISGTKWILDWPPERHLF